MTQRLHLVFGGELTDIRGTEFRDVQNIDVVGIFPNYASAYGAWKAKAQASVDHAETRYFIAHLHRLVDEEEASEEVQAAAALFDLPAHDTKH